MVYSNTEDDLEKHYGKLISANEDVIDRAQTHWQTRYKCAFVYRKRLLLEDITPTT